jgi:hypothetical protein
MHGAMSYLQANTSSLVRCAYLTGLTACLCAATSLYHACRLPRIAHPCACCDNGKALCLRGWCCAMSSVYRSCAVDCKKRSGCSNTLRFVGGTLLIPRLSHSVRKTVSDAFISAVASSQIRHSTSTASPLPSGNNLEDNVFMSAERRTHASPISNKRM